MNDQELAIKNIELSAEFSRYLFDHPEMHASIPSGAQLVLLPEHDEELKRHNLDLARKMTEAGEKIIFVKIGEMRPKRLSRIENAEFASHAW